MFTGLIERTGLVTGLEARGAGLELRIGSDVADLLQPGDSVAVNGVCLTARRCRDGEIHTDIGTETARVTTLGSVRVGQPVNLERALLAGARFGGHFVQGHVDGTGTVQEVRPDGETQWLTIRYPDELAANLVPKGSIAVDGVSLTVAALHDGAFDVMIIPFTWSHTTLSGLAVGDRVNLECDIVGKYVARAVEVWAARSQRSTP